MSPSLSMFDEDSRIPDFRGVYRENVAALVLRRDGRLLFGECADCGEEWQFPQGGVAKGETRREAMFRELREETGVRPTKVRVLTARSGYRYTFPNGRLKKGVYRGQQQTFFLCSFLGEPDDLVLEYRGVREFSQVEWVLPEEFPLDRTPEFKHHVYRAVMKDFFGVELPEA